MKYDIFICYRQDTGNDFASHLWNGLRDRNISAFLDVEDIPKKSKGTEAWWAFRNEAIRHCNVFLMIVTDGFEKSDEIRKEIALAIEANRDFMCMVEKGLPSEVQTTLLRQNRALRDLQQIFFSTSAELLRGVLRHYIEPTQEAMKGTPSLITQPPSKKSPFPLVFFKITQAIGNSLLVRRKLPSVSFNIRNSGDLPIKARVKARVFLGGKDLGLVKGTKRSGKYMGYYDGKTLWNLNPYTLVFGNFSVPKMCVKTDEDLLIVVSVTSIENDGKVHELLPVSWTFMRDKNDWFLEPTGDC